MTTALILEGWRRPLLACGLAALLHGSALAQARPGGQIPDALKDVKPATDMCRRDEYASAPAGTSAPVATPDIEPDLSCAIAVSELQPLLGRPATALMDLRPGADHLTFHIDGALNLNTGDLHAKPYWRSKTVVLVGSGKAERELYRECTRLKQSGYSSVRVLRGGMPAWLASGRAVIGQAPSAPQLARLTAAEFWIESQDPENLVVLGIEKKALQNDLSFSTVLPQNSAEAIRAVVERRRKELRNAPLAAAVLAADLGVTDDEVLQLQQSLAPVPLLVYTDTREALVRHAGVQKAIWTAQARGPKQPGCGL